MSTTVMRRMRRAAGTSVLVAAALLVPVTPASAAPSPATIVGTVTGQDGEVLPGLPVNFQGFPSGRIDQETTTDAEGRYRFTGIPADSEGQVYVIPPPHYTGGNAPYGYLRGGRSSNRFPHGSTTVFDLKLGLGAAMAGRVLDDRTGRGVAGTVVKLFWDGNGTLQYGAVVTTAADGTWWAHNLDQPRQRRWIPVFDGSGRSTDARFGWESIRAPDEPYVLPIGGVTRGIVVRLRPLAKIIATVTVPPGSEVGVTARNGEGRGLAFGTGGPLTLYPVATYGAGGATAPVCAYGVGITVSRPYGLAFQCRDVPFSSTAELKTSFTMAVGGAIQGTIGDGSFRGTIWVDWDGRRITGSKDDPFGSTYTIGNIPTGTYVVNALGYDGVAAQSAPVRVVQGKVTKHVDLTLS